MRRFKKSFKSVIKTISNVANSFIDLAKDAMKALEKAIAAAAEVLKQEISNATKFIEDKIKEAKLSLKMVLIQFKNHFLKSIL